MASTTASPEQAFYMKGSIDEAVEEGRQMSEEG